MVKSFKKAIACMLAVLMVAFSVPFTALAAYIDDFDPTVVSTYHPDLQIQFGALWDLDQESFTSLDSGTKNAIWDYSGIYGPPVVATVTPNTTTGGIAVTALNQTAALSAAARSEAGITAAEAGDKTYAQGDFFTATFVLKNVNAASAISFSLDHSSNIEPAGVAYVSRSSRVPMAVSENTDGNDWDYGGTTPVSGQSADLYGGAKKWDFESCDVSNNRIYIVAISTESQGNSNLTAPSNEDDITFTNPTTGAKDYAYTDTFIVATYVFKITGQFDANHPITFTPTDPTNTGFTQAYEGGSYTCLDAAAKYCATYAECSTTSASKQFTFFGMNINDQSAPPACDHTWVEDGDPTATCTAAGVQHYVCSKCQEEKDEPVAALGHNYGELHEAVAATCTTAGTIAYYQCSRCNAYFNSNQVEVQSIAGDAALGHNMTHVPAAAATCIKDGNVEYYHCSRCNKNFADANGETELSTVIDGTATGVHVWGAWVADGAAGHKRTCTADPDCTAVDTEAHVADEAVDENVVPAEVGVDGSKDVVVYCSVCGYEISRTPTVIPALTENFTFDRYEIAADRQSAKAIFVGDTTHTEDERDAQLSSSTTAATCTAAGETVYTASCDGADAATEANGGIVRDPIAALGHTMTYHAAVPATCTEPGTVAYYSCSVCKKNFADEDGNTELSDLVAPAAGHTMTYHAAVPASCAADGTIAYYSCSVCKKNFADENGNTELSDLVDPKNDNHVWGEWTEVTPATYTEDGEEERECSVCHIKETRAIASDDIYVTVDAATGGNVTGDVATGETKAYKFGDSYTITANPDTGYTFVCWEINGKNVSKSKTYNGKAFADVTINPVFAKAEAEEFTVVFYDLYKNVVSSQTVTSAAGLDVPTDAVMARAGYKFIGWDIDPATVTAKAVITGLYEIDEENGFTVTVTGVTDGVTIAGETTTEKTGIPYDTQVTIEAPSAQAFKIGETVVAVGTTYTFYVGANVTVEAVDTATAQTPAIIMTGAPTRVSGSHRFLFQASRIVPDGYTLEKVGFIYGKDLTDAEMILANAGKASASGSTIKVGYNTINAITETTLQYGITNMDAPACAKAFMVVKDNAGKETIVYSAMAVGNYS